VPLPTTTEKLDGREITVDNLKALEYFGFQHLHMQEILQLTDPDIVLTDEEKTRRLTMALHVFNLGVTQSTKVFDTLKIVPTRVKIAEALYRLFYLHSGFFLVKDRYDNIKFFFLTYYLLALCEVVTASLLCHKEIEPEKIQGEELLLNFNTIHLNGQSVFNQFLQKAATLWYVFDEVNSTEQNPAMKALLEEARIFLPENIMQEAHKVFKAAEKDAHSAQGNS
jgi:hypothetical protein